MRALLVALSLVLGACATASAQQMEIPGDGAHPVIGDPNAPWRQRAGASTAEVAAAHACLARGENCERLIQQPCLDAYDEDQRSPALERTCDWHAMSVWEDEVLALLTDLRGKLSDGDLKNLNDSETAWETSMLADVGLGMDYYSGGSISGPIGAHIRAISTERRAEYLYEIQQMVGE
jgi:hypothetical protein